MNNYPSTDFADQGCPSTVNNQKAPAADTDIPNNKSTQLQAAADPFQLQVEKLLALLGAQSRGVACNAEIEQTLSAIVPTSTTRAIGVAAACTPNDEGITEGQHRRNQEDKAKGDEDIHTNSGDRAEKRGPRTKVTIDSLLQQEEEAEASRNFDNKRKKCNLYLPETWNTLDDIPFGRAGAKMMVTFGDGHNPNPDAVAAVLMGTRTCLQYAIKDARALRRKQKREFLKARMATSLHTRKDDKEKFRDTGIGSCEVDPAMIFRAVSGYDPLSYDSKVGFDISQLEILFPEEMHAYKRWEKMHHDYEVSSKETEVATKAEEDDVEKNMRSEGVDDENNDKIENDHGQKEEEDGYGGHLRDRLAQFDVRTARMEEGWYMEFADVRQGGSFLSRRCSTNTVEDRQWNLERKRRLSTKVGGPRREATWETLNSLSVQFLHWVGFDPSSSLPPPNEEITEALAFLGHDFLGKIVEKAVSLRLQKKACHSSSNLSKTEEPILELGEGEQLEVQDIERALRDTSINSVPLYNASNSSSKSDNKVDGHALQLYFGPGFEDRLEMELDQMLITGNNINQSSTIADLSDEELIVRKEEDELFSKLTSMIPTRLEGVSDILGEVTDEHVLEQRAKHRKKQATKDAKREISTKRRYIKKKKKQTQPNAIIKDH